MSIGGFLVEALALLTGIPTLYEEGLTDGVEGGGRCSKLNSSLALTRAKQVFFPESLPFEP